MRLDSTHVTGSRYLLSDSNMRLNIKILIPVYDDWPSLGRLVSEIHAAMAAKQWAYGIVIVDDGSPSEMPRPTQEQSLPQGCEGITLMRLRKNLGHQRAIAVGLMYIHSEPVQCDSDGVVVMDGDGEDSPRDIERLVEMCAETGWRKIVFARRTRRLESSVFKAGYEIYCLLHRAAVGSVLRVGNFSVLPRHLLSALAVDPNLWNHFAAAVIASKLPHITLPTPRGRRYEGQSKLNFTGLVVHGLSALACYSERIGVRVIATAFVLMALSLGGVLAVASIRLFTRIAIPGWATTATGILLILCLQLLTVAFVFCLTVLYRRQSVSFVPLRDTSIYILSCVAQ